MRASTVNRRTLGHGGAIVAIALAGSVFGLGVWSSAPKLESGARSAEGAPVQGDLRSREGTQGTEILFQNRLPEAIRIYWIDYQGKEILYLELGSGQSYRQPTYVTHPWRIRSARNGRMIRTVVADGKITVVSAGEPKPSRFSGGTPAQRSPYAPLLIGVVAAIAWLGVVLALRFSGMSIAFSMYLASLGSLWVVFFYSAYYYGNPAAAVEGVFKPVIAAARSATSDPVLNFLIDACLIALGVALWIGVLMSGLLLMVVLIGLAMAVLLASTSITGAVIVAGAAIAAGVCLVRSKRQRAVRWGGSEESGENNYSALQEGGEPSRGDGESQPPRVPRVWPMGSRSQTREALMGGRYKQHYDSSYNKVGRSERRGLFGVTYDQHYDSNYRKVGHSARRSWLGVSYVQHYDSNDKKAGHSEERESFLGGKYIQHYDADGKKSGHTEKRSGWLGDYEVHYDKDGKRIDE